MPSKWIMISKKDKKIVSESPTLKGIYRKADAISSKHPSTKYKFAQMKNEYPYWNREDELRAKKKNQAESAAYAKKHKKG